MIKEVSYKGVTAIPSDYSCPDGTLDYAVNLIPENDELRPVLAPKDLFSFPAKYSLLLVHNVTGAQMLIFHCHDDNGELRYAAKDDLTGKPLDDFENITTPIPGVFIPDDGTIYDTAVIGNTICIASQGGLAYCLYRDGAYRFIGSRPPFIALEFGMLRENPQGRGGYIEADISIHKNMSPERVSPQTFGMESELADLTQQLYALILPEINDKITSQGKFYQPFFVRYAYRLYDGSHYWHSAPILMLPSATIPLLKIGTVTDGDDSDHVKVHTTSYLDRFVLTCRPCGVTHNINEGSLSDWSDIITAVDIFVSAPIYTYLQSEDLSTPWSSAKDIMRRAPFVRTNNILDSSGNISDTQIIALTGHYADDLIGDCIDRSFISDDSNKSTKYWNLAPNEDFVQNIRDTCNFYFYSSLSVATASTFNSSPAKLLPDDLDLTNLVTRQRLEDAYQCHHSLVPKTLFAFNSRLHCADISLALPKPLPLRSATERVYIKPTEGHHTDICHNASVTVYCRVNEQKYYAVRQAVTRTDSHISMDDIFNPSSYAPRYFFYPDANAYRAVISGSYTDSTGKTISFRHSLPLRPHDFLNGAFFFEPLAPGKVPAADTSSEVASADDAEISNKIYVSQVNNPFSFDPAAVVSVGNSRVFALSAAVKALSQGQFGQFPLYAFTSDGIWALQPNSSGTYSTSSPVSRDVCSLPGAITQTDSEVIYPSSRGLMLLSGSICKCISDAVDSKSPYDIPLASLPHLDVIHRMTGHADNDGCMSVVPFKDFIADARIIYDHAHNRLIVANPAKPYAYILALSDTPRWGMLANNIDYGVLSYPDTLAVSLPKSYQTTVDGQPTTVSFRSLLDFAQYGSTDFAQTMFVSRPLKLDCPDVYKTISCVVQRGLISHGDIVSALYGSNDLEHWSLVGSSSNRRLQGFSGSPYKFFRIACYATLFAHESISGASCSFTTKYTNLLR